MANLNNTTSSRLHPRYYRNFISWILGHLLKHKLLFTSGYLLLFVGTAISVLIPILLQYYFDTAIYLDFNAILTIGGLFLAFYLINFFMSSFGAWVNAKFSELVVKDVQVEFFESIHSKSMSFHDSARTGELLSMATSDSRQLSWMLLSILMFLLAIVTTISSLAAMYFLDPFLFLIFLVFIPPIAIAIIYYGRNLGPISIKRQFLFARWQATLQENLAGIRALRTLSNRERESEKYDNDLKAVREVLIKRGVLSTRYFPTLIIYFAMGIMFILGGYLVYLGEMTPGTVIAFNSLVLLLLNPSQFIRFTIFLGSMGFAGGQRVFSVISEQQELQDGTHTLNRRLAGKIKFENVSFRYSEDGPNILKDISFTIAPGQTVAVIGHTGCGKTTLQKLIQRLYDPSDGSILIDDIDVKDYPIESYRKQVGVIEQDIFLFSASIKENILYGFSEEEHSDLEEKMIQVAKSAQIHDYIESLPKKYDTVIGERGITLSGGQRQRLAIARAFMINPPILIMDDSTSAIDAKTEAEIQQAIKNLLESRTTIIVTHRLSTLRKADVVILMSGGTIEDIGSHKKLYTSNSEYAEMFHQFEDLPPIPDAVLTSTEKEVKEAI
ncbi:MAG: ABC transporter ATP-binding protein [Candidatus Hodarchaeales archaeon]|jgi:ATP-binding cassette subfamily B protein